jgi:anhydro-N-acetylmuramic acid kinase
MQRGDPNVIAAKTKIPVVSDFRRMDMALGGQGAPFAPAFHRFLFGGIEKRTAVVNIGGMANITILNEPLIGYDTGPGNVLMDSWIEEARGEKFDRDGEWAASGKVIPRLLNIMLLDSYFSQKAPKSTGREKFNLQWLKRVQAAWSRDFSRGISSTEISFPRLKSRLQKENVQRTLLELTAQTIADEVQKYDRELLLLCGGGAKNPVLFERIAALLPDCEVASTDDYGVSGDFMEAMAFAWLAHKRVHRESVELCSVTGAEKNGILGGLYE